MELAAEIRHCRVMANAAEAAGDPEAAAQLRSRGAELAGRVRATEARRQAERKAAADAYWARLSGRVAANLEILRSAGVDLGLSVNDFRGAR